MDGDQHSIDRARARIRASGLTDRVELVCSALEDLALDIPARVVVNNISMHECRDIDRVTENVRTALEPGGWFVSRTSRSPTPTRPCAACRAGS